MKKNKINYITYQTFPSRKANTIQTMDNIKYFEKYFKTMQIFPIAHYDPIIQIISDKLIRNI